MNRARDTGMTTSWAIRSPSLIVYGCAGSVLSRNHPDLPAVPRVDGAGGVDDGDAVLRRQPAAGRTKATEPAGSAIAAPVPTVARPPGPSTAAPRRRGRRPRPRDGRIHGDMRRLVKQHLDVCHATRLAHGRMGTCPQTRPRSALSRAALAGSVGLHLRQRWCYPCEPAWRLLPISLPVGVIVAVGLLQRVRSSRCCSQPPPRIEVDHRRPSVPGVRASAESSSGPADGVPTDADATAERGVELDARAWLLLRGWIPGLVASRSRTPADPTPYWVVATRHPGPS